MVSPIIDLQSRLGPELIPQTLEDVDAMDALFARCSRTARMQQTEDGTGREYGPGSNSPVYLKAFLARDSAGEHTRTDKQLRDALRSLAETESAEDIILKTEHALDRGSLHEANEYFTSLSAGGQAQPGAVSKYVEISTNFENDLVATLNAQREAAHQATIQAAELEREHRAAEALAEHQREIASRLVSLNSEYLNLNKQKATLDRQLIAALGSSNEAEVFATYRSQLRLMLDNRQNALTLGDKSAGTQIEMLEEQLRKVR